MDEKDRELTVEVSPLKVIPKKKLVYDLDSMRKAVKKCDESIKVFEKAIEDEQKTKKYYAGIVRQLEEDLDAH